MHLKPAESLTELGMHVVSPELQLCLSRLAGYSFHNKADSLRIMPQTLTGHLPIYYDSKACHI